MTRLTQALVIFLFATNSVAEPAEEVHPGAALYEANCASCHDQPVYKAPGRSMLGMLGPKNILRALNEGSMKPQAAAIDPAGRQNIAEFLSRQKLSDVQDEALPPLCDAAHEFDLNLPPVSRGWGVDLHNSRFQPGESGGLNSANVEDLEVKWSFAYPNAFQARSQPVYGGGAIYVGSQDGTLWALDAKTGCLRWSFQAKAEVRTGIVITPWAAGDSNADPTIFFGDILANAYSLDARTGILRWRVKADEHPYATLTGTPAYFEGRLYVSVSSLETVAATNPAYECCTFQGAVLALDAITGRMIWKSRSIDKPAAPAGKTEVGTTILAPSGAPIWSSPTIDEKRGQLYVGTGQNYSSPADGNSDAIIAFDLKTGSKRWVSQQTGKDAWNVACFVGFEWLNNANCPAENGPDYDFGSHAILVNLPDGQDIVVGGQKSGDVVGVDPDTGKTLWKNRIGRGGVQGGVHFGIAAQDDVVYVPINDTLFTGDAGNAKNRLPARPGVHAVNAGNGDLLWSALVADVCGETERCETGVSQAISAIPGAVIAGYLDGRVRIHARKDGRLLWESNLLREFHTVSGAIARGGAFSGGGVLVAHGMLYVNSGYGFNRYIPGNALVVFGLKENE
jgi:polyvinyl alcohol dehydrogenase (cytochrome)